jgi:[glutamine synthetase] adenylyltransferase / [glutamine synthetase]-adenylyl-L-tyrosine phosphorylase
VLAHAEAHPRTLTQWSDNVRIFETCAEVGLLNDEEATHLKKAYLAIRDMAHRCTLSGHSRIVGAGELLTERAWVSELWDKLLGHAG